VRTVADLCRDYGRAPPTPPTQCGSHERATRPSGPSMCFLGGLSASPTSTAPQAHIQYEEQEGTSKRSFAMTRFGLWASCLEAISWLPVLCLLLQGGGWSDSPACRLATWCVGTPPSGGQRPPDSIGRTHCSGSAHPRGAASHAATSSTANDARRTLSVRRERAVAPFPVPRWRAEDPAGACAGWPLLFRRAVQSANRNRLKLIESGRKQNSITNRFGDK